MKEDNLQKFKQHFTLLLANMKDELDRVKLCNWCGAYFFATRVDQVFCSDRCRVDQNQSSPVFKQKRRARARANYAKKVGR